MATAEVAEDYGPTTSSDLPEDILQRILAFLFVDVSLKIVLKLFSLLFSFYIVESDFEYAICDRNCSRQVSQVMSSIK